MPAISAGGIWPESLGRFATNYGYGRYYKDRGADLDGYSNRRGFYDDLLSSKNVYDVGKTFGGTLIMNSSIEFLIISQFIV